MPVPKPFYLTEIQRYLGIAPLKDNKWGLLSPFTIIDTTLHCSDWVFSIGIRKHVLHTTLNLHITMWTSSLPIRINWLYHVFPPLHFSQFPDIMITNILRNITTLCVSPPPSTAYDPVFQENSLTNLRPRTNVPRDYSTSQYWATVFECTVVKQRHGWNFLKNDCQLSF